jgi:hypothetical protein
MNFINEIEKHKKKLKSEFPIESQTTVEDKIVLLQLKNLMQKLNSYSYLEIGTYLGGSLTPFVKDSTCKHILSIDKRGRITPDERGSKISYLDIKEEQTIENLKKNNLDVSKIDFFNGSIDENKKINNKFDLCFIDGEHTDIACFRDFIYADKFMKNDAIIAFHDSYYVYKALMMINELLESKKKKFKFIKIFNTSISLILFNKFADIKVENYFVIEKNLEKFYQFCEKKLLESSFRNRVKINLSVEDMPIKSKF